MYKKYGFMEEKKIKKLGKQKKFGHKCGKIVVGTTNAENCKATYVRLETWMTTSVSLDASIEAIRRRFIVNLSKYTRIYFEDDVRTHIIDYDYSTTKLTDKPGKKSFVAIEITLLANSKFDFDSDFIFSCQNFGDTCFSLLETLSSHFSMDISKK